MANFVLSVDLGSTWTKALLASVETGEILGRKTAPTTTADLTEGFDSVAIPLLEKARELGGRTETFLSSSAKGGLRLAAIGLVPDLTAKAARLAAFSSGGKVVADFAYKLTADDLRRLADAKPDIVILAGGTDGGDERCILANARALAGSDVDAAIIYAGNAAVRGQAMAELAAAGKRTVAAANLLPELDRLEIAEARQSVARLFMERIVEGKGLAAVAARCTAPPRPTPAAVMELIALLSGHGGKAFGAGIFGGLSLLVVDLGGATTDVYSASDGFKGDADTVYRGLPEPYLKRSVEGDLGLRASAPIVAAHSPSPNERLTVWAHTVADHPEQVAANAAEAACDAALADICVRTAIQRHAGSLEERFTPNGRFWLQTGKDLRGINLIIGSGGYLARSASLFGQTAADRAETSEQDLPLTPLYRNIRYQRDADYVFPLAGNLAVGYPELASAIARASLRDAAVFNEERP